MNNRLFMVILCCFTPICALLFSESIILNPSILRLVLSFCLFIPAMILWCIYPLYAAKMQIKGNSNNSLAILLGTFIHSHKCIRLTFQILIFVFLIYFIATSYHCEIKAEYYMFMCFLIMTSAALGQFSGELIKNQN